MSDVLTGCRARFSINGAKVGYASNVSVREMVQYEKIRVLDNIQGEEHVPVDYDVSVTADLIRLVGRSLQSLGWMPKQGQSPKEHLSNILALGTMAATLEDNETGEIVASLEGVRIQEQNLRVDSRGVAGVNVSFVALRVRFESDLG